MPPPLGSNWRRPDSLSLSPSWPASQNSPRLSMDCIDFTPLGDGRRERCPMQRDRWQHMALIVRWRIDFALQSHVAVSAARHFFAQQPLHTLGADAVPLAKLLFG